MNFPIFITLRYTSFVLAIHWETYRHRHGMCVGLCVCVCVCVKHLCTVLLAYTRQPSHLIPPVSL